MAFAKKRAGLLVLAVVVSFALSLGSVRGQVEPERANRPEDPRLEDCSAFAAERGRHTLNVTLEFTTRAVVNLEALDRVLDISGLTRTRWISGVASLSGCQPIVASVARFPLLTALLETGAKEADCGKRNIERSTFRISLEEQVAALSRTDYQINSQLMPIISAQASVLMVSASDLLNSFGNASVLLVDEYTDAPASDIGQTIALGVVACLLALFLALICVMYWCGCLRCTQSRSKNQFLEISEELGNLDRPLGTPTQSDTGIDRRSDADLAHSRTNSGTEDRVNDKASSLNLLQVPEDASLRKAHSKFAGSSSWISHPEVPPSEHGAMPPTHGNLSDAHGCFLPEAHGGQPPQASHGYFGSSGKKDLHGGNAAPSKTHRESGRPKALTGTRHLSMIHGPAPVQSVTLPGQGGLGIGKFMRLISRLKVDFNTLKIEKEIGRGSCKTVYLGRWGSTAVAITRMQKGGMATEARIMQRLGTHPNLVQFYRWSRDHHGNEFMIMELVPNGSLDKLLMSSQNESLDFMSKLKMCEQICDAMCELAREGLLHCDLAARNVLVASISPIHVKVADFGMAREWELQQDQAEGDEERKMLDCIPVRWAAPEVFRDGTWSEKSDVWAFGVTMWEIFASGEEPFVRDLGDVSNETIIQHVISGNYLSRPSVCPPLVYGIMKACWAYEVENRPTFDLLQHRFHQVRAQIRNMPRPLAQTHTGGSDHGEASPGAHPGSVPEIVAPHMTAQDFESGSSWQPLPETISGGLRGNAGIDCLVCYLYAWNRRGLFITENQHGGC
eukprot:jgi/Tetstr1/441893/TSEL_030102.t1